MSCNNHLTAKVLIKSAVLEYLNKPLSIIESIEIPLLKKGQILIKMSYAAVCHSQLMEIRGKRGEDKYLPHMLGHEGVGEVIALGDGITKVKLGDKVILGWIKGEGLDAGGTVYQCGDKKINAGAITTFSNYSVVSENRVVILPDGFDEKLAVLLGCALPTGSGMVLNELKPKEGASVVVLGLGGIGLSSLIALSEFKLKHIIALDVEPNKLELAKKLGATQTYLTDKKGIVKFKEKFPDGVDYVLESAGLCQTIELGFSLLNKQGLCLFASHPEFGEKISIDPHELITGKTIKGSWGGSSFPDKDIPKIAKIIANSKLPVDLLLSNTYRLADINQAISDLEQRKIVRALISFI